MWGGADATRDVWLLYTGVTLAPFSKNVYSDGIRLRMTSGYGRYAYDGHRLDCSASGGRREFCTSVAHRFSVDFAYSDALVGYHMRLGTLTAKAFAGATMMSHTPDAYDAKNHISGVTFGATGALEFWLNTGDRSWSSLDLSYTTAYDTAAARFRSGWRVLPTLSIGPEARYDRNSQDGAGRLGLFVRYDWFGGEVSVATGISDTLKSNSGNRFEPYATLNMLTQF
jgi:Cellulose biosynthesis protein BcsS